MPNSQLGSTPSRIDAFAAQYTMRCPSVPRLSLGTDTAWSNECPPTPSCVIRLNAGWSLIHAIVDVATFVFHVCTKALAASVGRKCSTPVLKLT